MFRSEAFDKMDRIAVTVVERRRWEMKMKKKGFILTWQFVPWAHETRKLCA